MRRTITILIGLLAICIQMDAQSTLKEGMEMLRQQYGISYIYDSSLPILGRYNGDRLNAGTLQENLSRLFHGSGIDYIVKGRQVILKKERAVSPEYDYSLSQPELLDSSVVVDWRMPILTHPQSGAGPSR